LSASDSFVHFLVQNRHYAVMAATDPAARRDKLDESATLRQRGLTLIIGDNPTGAQRLAGGAAFFIPECLPDLADLTDEELREALQTMLLHLLRVPSGPREWSAAREHAPGTIRSAPPRQGSTTPQRRTARNPYHGNSPVHRGCFSRQRRWRKTR
jgi:hypothetical protein